MADRPLCNTCRKILNCSCGKTTAPTMAPDRRLHLYCRRCDLFVCAGLRGIPEC
jgi:hypothetical protein